MSDVGYILGHQDEYEELRYSLRSLKHFPHDNVWVAGAPPPDWSVGLNWIPVEQASLANRGQAGNVWWNNRKTNMRTNLLALLDHSEVSDRFLYMNDDFILVKEFTAQTALPHLGTFVESHRGRLDDKKGAYPDLYEWFIANGVSDPLHVSEHVPMLVDGRLAGMMRQVSHIIGYPYASLWGNLTDVPLIRGGPDVRDGDWVLRHQSDQKDDWPEHWWSVSTVERSFHEWPVGKKIRDLFPEKSEYEQ